MSLLGCTSLRAIQRQQTVCAQQQPRYSRHSHHHHHHPRRRRRRRCRQQKGRHHHRHHRRHRRRPKPERCRFHGLRWTALQQTFLSLSLLRVSTGAQTLQCSAATRRSLPTVASAWGCWQTLKLLSSNTAPGSTLASFGSAAQSDKCCACSPNLQLCCLLQKHNLFQPRPNSCSWILCSNVGVRRGVHAHTPCGQLTPHFLNPITPTRVDHEQVPRGRGAWSAGDWNRVLL
jgi:hypothetical protein